MKTLKQHIDRILRYITSQYRAYGSKLLFYIGRVESPNKSLLHNLRNIHQGKRAFIVCNGPSLRAEDLELLHQKGEISFACNKIDKIFSQTSWRPTYYAVLDETYQHSLLDTMNSIPAHVKFFRKESYITTRKVKGDKVFLNAIGGRELLQESLFSEDASSCIYTIATTTYSLLQIAVHMGIREIYIIGCDNSYGLEIKPDGTIVDTGRKSYFAGSKEADQKTAAATWEMNIVYEYARKYADTHNIRIYNATRGGYLEAFERVDFDTLFQ